MKIIKFNIPIYGGEVKLIFTNDFVKASRKLGYQVDLENNNCRGMAYRFASNDYVMMIKKHRRDDISVLAHECLHITNYILKDKGVGVSTKNDEAQTYLLGYIMGSIQRLKDKHKPK